MQRDHTEKERAPRLTAHVERAAEKSTPTHTGREIEQSLESGRVV